MSGPSIRFRLPPASLFKFPPDPNPAVLPAPHPSESFRTFAAPFAIPQDLYNAVFSAYIPVTIASVYAVTILYMNGINRERGGKPYAISRTRAFHVFVVAHNIALAVFSGLVFWAMMRALAHTWPSYREYPFLGKLWPGIRTQHGFAGAADALCKMHGPRGLGDAAVYNAKKGLWEIQNKTFQLGATGKPDPTDLGRIWNEGLAFWGWFFYLSKFYEVVDTAIIILKGKRSSTLQTYHHSGAMFAMWAGMRYMSAPIWMFVWFNSGIHAMMYTYYTLSALGFKIPRRLKKTLTTMQITQFFVGIVFASGHLFVEYTIPSSITYASKHGLKHAASAVSAAVATIATAITDPTATAGVAAWLKKLAFRAAGEEGLAENVRNQYGEVFGPEADHVQSALEQMRRNPTYETVSCINTTGQSFAIWLNIVYLAPLSWLFLRFFFRSYSRRTSTSTQHPTHRRKLSESAEDAAQRVEREFDSIGRSAEDGLSELVRKVSQKSADNRRISETIEKFENGLSKGYDQALEKGKQIGDQVVKKKESVKDLVGKWRDMSPSGEEGSGSNTPQKAKEGAQDLVDRGTEAAKDQLQQAAQQAKKGANQVEQKTKEKAGDTTKGSKPTVDEGPEKASQAKEAAKDQAGQRRDSAKGSAKDAKEAVKDTADKAKDTGKQTADKAKTTGKQTADKAKDAGKQTADKANQGAKEASKQAEEKAEDAPPKAKEEEDGGSDSGEKGDDSTAQGPEESGVLVERHNEGTDSQDRAKDESDVASPPATSSTTADDSSSPPPEAPNDDKKENEKPEGGDAGDEKDGPISTGPVTTDNPQGLSTTDSSAPGAKTYADELK